MEEFPLPSREKEVDPGQGKQQATAGPESSCLPLVSQGMIWVYPPFVPRPPHLPSLRQPRVVGGKGTYDPCSKFSEVGHHRNLAPCRIRKLQTVDKHLGLAVSQGFSAPPGEVRPGTQVCRQPGLCLLCLPVLPLWIVAIRSLCEVRYLFSPSNTSYNINRKSNRHVCRN